MHSTGHGVVFSVGLELVAPERVTRSTLYSDSVRAAASIATCSWYQSAYELTGGKDHAYAWSLPCERLVEGSVVKANYPLPPSLPAIVYATPESPADYFLDGLTGVEHI